MNSIFKLFQNKTFVILFLCTLLIVLFRLHTLYEPLERDLGTYALYGHEMLQGKNLYTNLFDHKPPLVYVTYAIFELLFGYGEITIFIMGVFFCFVTLLCIYYAGNTINKNAGYLSAVCWTIISVNIPLQANQPNVEVFMNAFLLCGLAVLLRHYKTISFRQSVFIGLMLGISSLYKHLTFIPILALPLTIVFLSNKQRFIQKIKTLAPIIYIPLFIWIMLFSYYYFFNDFEAFIYAVFTFNIGYSQETIHTTTSGGMVENIIKGFVPTILFTRRFFSFLPIVIFAFIGTIRGIIRKEFPWIMLAVYSLSVALMISVPGKWYPHYYQLWLPVFSLGAGWFLAETVFSTKKNIYKTLILITLLSIGIIQYRFLFWTVNDISTIKYGRIFVEAKSTAKIINSVLVNDETFFQYGSDPVLYFYTKRKLPTGITFLTFLDFGKHSNKVTEILISEINLSKPELIVVEIPTVQRINIRVETPKNTYYEQVVKWILENYVESKNLGTGYWIRKNSRLHLLENHTI